MIYLDLVLNSYTPVDIEVEEEMTRNQYFCVANFGTRNHQRLDELPIKLIDVQLWFIYLICSTTLYLVGMSFSSTFE